MKSNIGQILHGTELFSRFNTQAGRRDKWFRLAQYVSRLIVLHSTDIGWEKLEVILRLKKLESAASDARKLYRIFGSIAFLQKAIELYRKPGPDQTINSMSIVANIAKALWLFQDHFLWLGKIGIMQVNKEKLGRGGAWCWLVALGCLIIRDFRQITNLEQEMDRLRALRRDQQQSFDDSQLKAKDKEWQTAQVELLKDCLDITLPLSTLGRVGPKFAALCGVLSTLIGIKQEFSKLT